MNRSLFQILGVVTMLGIVVPVSGLAPRQSKADTAGLHILQPNTVVALGLKTAEWQQIEAQLPVGLQEVKLTAGDAQIRDYFGTVAVSGDTVVVAATGEDGGCGDWSPNGQWLALYAGPANDRDIYLVAVDGSLYYQVTDGGDNLGPSFSPDGNWLVFTSGRDGDNDLYLIRLDGTFLTPLTINDTSDWQPRWGR